MALWFAELWKKGHYDAVERVANQKGVRTWLSNSSKRIPESRRNSILNRLEKEPKGAWPTLGDTVLIEGSRDEVTALYNSVPEWKKGKPRLHKPVKVLEGNEGFFFDLLNISWWDRRTSVEKAAVALAPIAAVGLVTTQTNVL